MFFAPALIVAAASAISAAPLAMPAEQAIQQNLNLDLEDKDAFFLFDMIKKVFGKRDLETLEDKDAFFLFDMIKKVFGKRDLETLEDKDAFFLFDMIKKVFGKRDLETLEDKDAFFLFDMIKKVFGKRGLEGEISLDNMDEDEKKAFWGAVAKWGVPIVGGLISGLPDLIHGKKNKRDLELEDKDAFFLFDMIKKVFGKRGLEGEVNLENMDEDEKKAFWGAVAKWGLPIVGGLFSGMGSSNKRDLDHEVLARAVQELDLEDKDAFFLFDMIKKVFGKRDLEEVEDKDAFFLFDIIKKVFGKRGLEGEVDLDNMNDDEKKAFWGALVKWGLPIVGGLFSGSGKRDLDHEVFARAVQELDLEDKDAFFLFDMIKKVFGKRDLEEVEDKDAFFLFDMIKKVFGKRGLEGEVDLDNMNDDEKKAFWGALVKWGLPIVGGLISGSGKRDLEQVEDKDAFFLFDMIKKVFGKRDLELEDKDAFFLFDMIKKVFGKRDLYDLPTVPSSASFARRAVQDQGLLDALNDF